MHSFYILKLNFVYEKRKNFYSNIIKLKIFDKLQFKGTENLILL